MVEFEDFHHDTLIVDFDHLFWISFDKRPPQFLHTDHALLFAARGVHPPTAMTQPSPFPFNGGAGV